MKIEELKYPVGKFKFPTTYNEDDLKKWIEEISSFPEKLSNTVKGLSKDQLLLNYRPDGWSIRQVVHHCAESHMNAFIRFKLTLTEESPVVKSYFENLCAELPDGTSADIEDSLMILTGLHRRWIYLIESLNDQQLNRAYIQPEYNKSFKLWEVLALYAWHCDHHLAHVFQALDRKGDFD
ncbi:MAG: putative metal-dependent hydrolase [Cyclobacteriaceae bacterium]